MTGISTGAETPRQMAISYPEFMDGILPISGGAPGTTQAFHFGPLVLLILETCAGWNGGNYEENPRVCASNAMSVFVPFLYTREWWAQYIEVPEMYTKWRNTEGDYIMDIQDARDLYYRQRADMSGWFGDTPGFNGDVTSILKSIKAKTLFPASPYDQFVPREYYELQVKTIPDGRVVWIDSVAGHLICCNADPNATRVMGKAIRSFLQELSAQRQTRR